MKEIILKGKKVIDIEREALDLLKESLDEQFAQAVCILKEAIEADKKIVILGVGKSGNVGHKIAATLNSTGATAVVLNAQNALHGDLGIVSDGDAVIALSYSGETAELLDLLPHIKKRDIKLVGITGKKGSTLAECSDAHIVTPVAREACPLGLAPTSSSTSALVVGDALAMTLLDERGFTEEEFAKYHPSGSLGRALLLRVKDIMRSGERLATCSHRATVMEAITAMTEARSGVCVVVGDKGCIQGVFSHGDFARAYQKNASIGASQVADFMTPEPITLNASDLAVEAIKVIRNYQVDDVPVRDEDGVLVGVVDTQDFASLKLV